MSKKKKIINTGDYHRIPIVSLLSVPPAKAHPDTLCLHQDHTAESPKSPRVLGPYLENNYSNLYSKTSNLLKGESDGEPAHPPTGTYVKSIFTILREKFDITRENV